MNTHINARRLDEKEVRRILFGRPIEKEYTCMMINRGHQIDNLTRRKRKKAIRKRWDNMADFR